MLQALLLAASLTGPSPLDTIVEMRRGDRVVIENLSGDIVVEGWGRDQMEIVTEDREARVLVSRRGSVLVIGPDEGRRRRRSVDARIRLPVWADLEVGGLSLDISIEGLDGALDIGSVNGDIVIRDAGGRVEVRSIDGEVRVQNARSGVLASSQSDDVSLIGVTGPVEVHSGSGDLRLEDIRSASVRAETQDGDITYDGTIEDGGSYGFFVHDGDAVIAVPETMDARVSVSTFDGEFESAFPVVVQRFTGGREFEFVLGDGRARIQIEVFDGEIRLLPRR